MKDGVKRVVAFRIEKEEGHVLFCEDVTDHLTASTFR
jgi:hypothetical protein